MREWFKKKIFNCFIRTFYYILLLFGIVKINYFSFYNETT